MPVAKLPNHKPSRYHLFPYPLNAMKLVEATVRLCDSYESLGPRERTEGMGAGEPVAKDWKFKARSAIRGILGRGKASWEGTDGWEQLRTTMEQLKG